jgi:hypothetical protein
MKQTQSKPNNNKIINNFTRFFALHKTILMNGISSVPFQSSPLHSMCKTTDKEIGRILLSVCGGHLTLVKSNSNGSKYLEHIHK